MRCRQIHGVRVGWEQEGPSSDLVGQLLSRFPEVECVRPELQLFFGVAGAEAYPSPPGRQVFFQGQVRGFCAEDGLWLWDGASRARIDVSGAAVHVDAAPSSLSSPRTFSAGFLFVALVIALRHHGLLHLHSAGLVDALGRTVVVSGPAGAGKSTVALTLAHAGCRYLGDDAVFLARREPGVAVLSFPREFHVGPQALEAFPRLGAHSGEPYADSSGKRALSPDVAFPGAFLWEAPAPGLLVFPEVTGGERTRLAPLARAEAFGRMLQSSALAVVDGMPCAAEQIELLRRVCDEASACEVHLGRDALARPELLAGLVLGVSG